MANDGETDSSAATISLNVAAVNDPPVAQDGSASGTEDTPVTGTLVATDVDSEGLTYRLGTQAAHGTAVVNPDGSFTYTPNADFNGTDSFTFLANDGAADSNTATINLTIAAVNDAPLLDLDADDSTVAFNTFCDSIFRRPRTDLGSGRRDRGPGQRDARVRDHRPPHPEPRRSPLGERAAAGRDQRVGLRSRHRHSHAQR